MSSIKDWRPKAREKGGGGGERPRSKRVAIHGRM